MYPPRRAFLRLEISAMARRLGAALPPPKWGGTARRSRARVGKCDPSAVGARGCIPHPDRFAIVPPHEGEGV